MHPDELVDVGLGVESGFEVVERLDRAGSPAPSSVILISTHAEQDFADMIATSPAIGFLSKSALTLRAISDLILSSERVQERNHR